MPTVVQVTHSGQTSRPHPGLDVFLQAPIDDDRTDLLFTVLSALARLDLDPWHEAATLAAQSRSAAVIRLTSLIAAIPSPTATPRDAAAIAARLVALLPSATRTPDAPAAERPTRTRRTWPSRAMLALVVVTALLGTSMVSGWPLDLQSTLDLPASQGNSPLGVQL